MILEDRREDGLRGVPPEAEREGGAHALWTNPANGSVEAVPRPTDIPEVFGRKICRGLGVPELGR